MVNVLCTSVIDSVAHCAHIALWATARLPACATHGHAQLFYLTGRVVVTFPSLLIPTTSSPRC